MTEDKYCYSLEDLELAFKAGRSQTTKKDYMNENEFGIPEYQVWDYPSFEDYMKPKKDE